LTANDVLSCKITYQSSINNYYFYNNYRISILLRMRTKIISLSYKESERAEELAPDDQELSQAAAEAALNAYAPYSGFRVGAAVRLRSGVIVCGTNVENAAFPSGICAERNALSNAISNHPGDRAIAIAVSAIANGALTDEPVAPCGNCRQVIAEEESRNGNEIRLILRGRRRTLIIGSAGSLLPIMFNSRDLGVILP
jgi:cytidine deaminase